MYSFWLPVADNILSNWASIAFICITYLYSSSPSGVNLKFLVFDVNNLKLINDHYGHEFGNKLLIIASSAIATVFNYISTYRVGGDEFVVILENETDEEVEELIASYDALIKDCYIDCPSKRHYIDVAYGHAKYDPSIDSCFEDVFSRADSFMYQMKKELKEKHNK